MLGLGLGLGGCGLGLGIGLKSHGFGLALGFALGLGGCGLGLGLDMCGLVNITAIWTTTRMTWTTTMFQGIVAGKTRFVGRMGLGGTTTMRRVQRLSSGRR